MDNPRTNLSNLMREGFRRVASTVAVLTAGQGQDAVAMTATAFTSVSLDPPAVLVCVNRSARLHAAVVEAGGFRVNVLTGAHTQVAQACSGGELEARFRTGTWSRDLWPGPRLDDSLFSVTSRIRQAIDVGTHTIFIGDVEDIDLNDGPPLLYANGAYAAT
ncbi:flavin reductase family protein [Caulobacter sp. DWP3-1-3b2]|uniref:flavin reductase family protein n=1 Tax=Caulobacter sp. DWP3-1-3b2 TaxID=2804643 RepID=UPI003CF95D5A